METYARGIPTYKGENGQTIGLLCETKEICITDDDGVRLSDKLANMQQQIGEGPDTSGFATEEFVNNAVSGLASTQYVDNAVSNASGGDADTLEGHNASYFATADSVTDIVNGTTTVGKASSADRATTADTATRATTADSATTATTADRATTADTATRATTADSATTATTADTATRATTADSATKATSDGSGNNIATTYLKKSGVVITATDPGVGATVTYADDTLIFVYE